MTRSLSRCLAMAILILVPAAVLAPIVVSVMVWRDDIAQRAETASLVLEKYGDQASRVTALRETLSALEASAESDGNLIPGSTDALASAMLQTRTKQLVESGGGLIQSLQILPAKADATLSRVAVRVQFTARSENLQKIIYSVETATPLLKINALEIRQERLSSGSSGAKVEREGDLVVQLEVAGFRRAEQAL